MPIHRCGLIACISCSCDLRVFSTDSSRSIHPLALSSTRTLSLPSSPYSDQPPLFEPWRQRISSSAVRSLALSHQAPLDNASWDTQFRLSDLVFWPIRAPLYEGHPSVNSYRWCLVHFLSLNFRGKVVWEFHLFPGCQFGVFGSFLLILWCFDLGHGEVCFARLFGSSDLRTYAALCRWRTLGIGPRVGRTSVLAPHFLWWELPDDQWMPSSQNGMNQLSSRYALRVLGNARYFQALISYSIFAHWLFDQLKAPKLYVRQPSIGDWTC